jgi:hypothetical protein
MDVDRAIIVAGATILVVILFNVMLYLSLRRGDEVTTIDMVRKAARRARQPWKDEDDALQELSKLVNNLKDDSNNLDKPQEEPPGPEPENHDR